MASQIMKRNKSCRMRTKKNAVKRNVRASTGFANFMNSPGPGELREPNKFFAEDMDDGLAILETLQK